MKIDQKLKRILLLPIFATLLLIGFMTFLSSPSVETAASTVSRTSTTLLPQIQTVDWDTIPTTTSPPTTVGRKKTPEVRPAPHHANRGGTITGHCGPSTNPYVNPCGCEASHPQEWSPSGKYYGKYQYGKDDWARNGGDPAKYGNATEAEQDAVAANTHYDAWPNC